MGRLWQPRLVPPLHHLDEPRTGLDLPSSERIRAAIGEERACGVTVILTTHELTEAAAPDWVLQLAGRIVAAGPPGEVLESSRLSEANGVAFVTHDFRQMIDDAGHRPRAARHSETHARTGPDLEALPQ